MQFEEKLGDSIFATMSWTSIQCLEKTFQCWMGWKTGMCSSWQELWRITCTNPMEESISDTCAWFVALHLSVWNTGVNQQPWANTTDSGFRLIEMDVLAWPIIEIAKATKCIPEFRFTHLPKVEISWMSQSGSPSLLDIDNVKPSHWKTTQMSL